MLSRENSTTETTATNKDASSTTTATTATTTTTIPSVLKDKLTASEERFKYGVIIRGKFIGVEDVKEDHGDEICKISMIKLKALVLAKKEHKQRICVKVSLDGVEILDERTNTPMFNHAVTKISYIARDPDDSRAIGYIFKNNANSFQYFAIKTLGQAQELFNTLKELFEVVLEMRTRAKKLKAEAEAAAGDTAKKDETAGAKPASSPTDEQSKDQEMIGLANTIQKMNEQPPPPPPAPAEASLFDVNSDPNNLVSSFEDTLNLASPAVQSNPAASQAASDPAKTPSDDLFSLMDPATNAPSPQDNQLSMLKAQISNIQTFAIPPPRIAPAVPSPGVNPMMANPFGMGVAAQPMTPPTPSANPFGNMGVAMGVPLTQFAPPGGASVGGGFISPNPNVFSSQIPNPQAAVNPNPSTSQLPW